MSFAAHKGSQKQIQEYVNRKAQVLNGEIRKKVNRRDIVIQWKSPLKKDGYEEYRDSDFLSKVGLSKRESQLKPFWPLRGPVWDALAVTKNDKGMSGVLLVEAKSHPGEMESFCRAGVKSLRKIQTALVETKNWLGVNPRKKWTAPYYQYANRIAHVFFLRELCDVQAWLVNIYFLNDPTHKKKLQTSRSEWIEYLKTVNERMGLDPTGNRFRYVKDVFLNGLDV